ncbi:unnamed protein product [Leuciscus chuanchicus]
MRKVKPRVRLMRKKLPDAQGLRISCLATGFYPRHINLTLFRDDQPVDDDQITGGQILPNGDGTYQMRKSLVISDEELREGHKYNCTMKHLNLDNKLDIIFDLMPLKEESPELLSSTEIEMPMRKRRRMDSSVKLRWSGIISDQNNVTAPIDERRAEDQNCLQSSARAAEDHGLQEALSGGLEDQQVQTPPAPVHHSPVSPAPGHNNRVDETTEDNILSRYEMGRILGKGSFGSVYEGQRLEDGLEVAVKIARKPQNMKYISIPGHPGQLPLEVGLLILANRGPKVSGIIELLDWQDQPDQYIMVLERPSPCEDLRHFWKRHKGILDEDTARFIMAQATMAAHMSCRRGVFHRDVKLENLLINTETLEVKLIDFGCGDLLQEAGYERFSGTRRYCPPEYYTEGKYHGRPATVWSLGVLLFLLVCGRYPEPRDRQMIDEDTWSDPGLSNAPKDDFLENSQENQDNISQPPITPDTLSLSPASPLLCFSEKMEELVYAGTKLSHSFAASPQISTKKHQAPQTPQPAGPARPRPPPVRAIRPLPQRQGPHPPPSARVKPRVRLMRKKLPDAQGLRISCLATGFYPRHINLTLFRDDQPVDDDQITGRQILPNGDGTYQMRKSLVISDEELREGHKYNCTMKHLNLDNKLDIIFGK